MVEHAAVTQTGTAVAAVEFIAMANVISTLAALYGSIDQLKHPKSFVPCSRRQARCGLTRSTPPGNEIDQLNIGGAACGQIGTFGRANKLKAEPCDGRIASR